MKENQLESVRSDLARLESVQIESNKFESARNDLIRLESVRTDLIYKSGLTSLKPIGSFALNSDFSFGNLLIFENSTHGIEEFLLHPIVLAIDGNFGIKLQKNSFSCLNIDSEKRASIENAFGPKFRSSGGGASGAGFHRDSQENREFLKNVRIFSNCLPGFFRYVRFGDGSRFGSTMHQTIEYSHEFYIPEADSAFLYIL